MSAAFTPGPPWYSDGEFIYSEADRQRNRLDGRNSHGGANFVLQPIAKIMTRDAEVDWVGRARLIAAAPELFAKLQEWLFLADSKQISATGLHAFADETRELLAKARGEA